MRSTSATVTPLESILRRDRAVVLGAPRVVVLASWAYVLAGTGTGMSAWQMSSLDLALGRAKAMPTGGVSADAMSGGRMSDAMGDAMLAMATPARWNLEYAGIMVSMPRRRKDPSRRIRWQFNHTLQATRAGQPDSSPVVHDHRSSDRSVSWSASAGARA